MDSGKSWRRRLRSLISVIASSVACARCGRGRSRPSAATQRSGMATLEAFLDGVAVAHRRLQARALDGRSASCCKRRRARCRLKRPNRFRWTLRRADRARRRRRRHATLDLRRRARASHGRAVRRHRRREPRDAAERRPQRARGVRRRARRTRADGLEWVKLAPQVGRLGFQRRCSIGFSGTAPRRLELVDGLDQVTRIELDNLVVNPELADERVRARRRRPAST